MILTNEKGVTLQALIITIVLLLILTSIGATAGTSALEYSKYSKLKTELQLLQTKVNELNENNDFSKGQDLNNVNNAQKEILEKEEVKSIIYKGKEDKKDEVKKGFKFFSVSEIKSDFDLSGIERSYLINVDYRYVVSCEGFKYKNVTYYMIDQMDDGMYNVEYHNKNINPGSSNALFDATSNTEGNERKITISNIQYNEGYVSKWEVKYKLNTEENWQTSNQLEFTVDKPGTYNVKVVHGDEIDLGQKNVEVYPVYVTSNLILNYDAINNISGTEHSESASIWKDLSNSKNDAQITGATWDGNYLSFDGVDDFARTTSSIDYEESCAVTVQFVLKGSLTPNVTQMIFESSENFNEVQAGYGVDFNEYGTNNINTTFHSDVGYNLKKTDDNIISDSDVNIITVVINNYYKLDSFIKVYKNGELLSLNKVDPHGTDISNVKFRNFEMYIASRAGNSNFAKMKLGAFRVYNRELTQSEVKDNYVLDSKRYE